MAARDIKTSKNNKKVDVTYIFNSNATTKE
jgi:hypothetical protein